MQFFCLLTEFRLGSKCESHILSRVFWTESASVICVPEQTPEFLPVLLGHPNFWCVLLYGFSLPVNDADV